MNVKPDELCVVLPPRTGGYCPLTDHVVTAVCPLKPRMAYPDLDRAVIHQNFSPDEWLIKMPWKELVSEKHPASLSQYGRMWQRRLRPLRDPGPDAVDETLLRLPSPSRETSPA